MPELLYHRLSNGLELIGEAGPERESAAIGFFVKTGSRDESAPESGVSHFLEHMMFKGTARKNALELSYALGNIGAQANAFTSEESTVYYASVLPEYFREMQGLLCEMLRPALSEDEFNTERGVILEEIALYRDKPHFFLFEQALLDYFGSHPAGKPVLGTADSIGAMTRAQMADYFGRRYSPSNMALVACGKFDWESFVTEAENLCGGWVGRQAKRDVRACPARVMEKDYRRKGLNQSHVLLLGKGPSSADEDRYDFSVLSHVLGDASGSRLYWSLVNTGKAESAGADNDERSETGVFVAYASTDPRLTDEVTGILRMEMGKLRQIEEEEVSRAKTKVAAKIVFNGELPLGRLMSIGSAWTSSQKIMNLPEEVDRTLAVTRDSCLAALERFALDKWGIFRLLPA